jgi:hypothetical protein
MSNPVKVAAFEKCGCCSEVYFLFIRVGVDYLVRAVTSRDHAFIELDAYKANFFPPMTDFEYSHWAEKILNSLLPEKDPKHDEEITQKHNHNLRAKEGIIAVTSRLLVISPIRGVLQ